MVRLPQGPPCDWFLLRRCRRTLESSSHWLGWARSPAERDPLATPSGPVHRVRFHARARVKNRTPSHWYRQPLPDAADQCRRRRPSDIVSRPWRVAEGSCARWHPTDALRSSVRARPESPRAVVWSRSDPTRTTAQGESCASSVEIHSIQTDRGIDRSASPAPTTTAIHCPADMPTSARSPGRSIDGNRKTGGTGGGVTPHSPQKVSER